MFIKMIKDNNWDIKDDKEIPLSFFVENYNTFTNFGGDMETLLFNCKIEHGKRVFCLKKEEKKKLTKEDLDKALEKFINNRPIKKPDIISTMYM